MTNTSRTKPGLMPVPRIATPWAMGVKAADVITKLMRLGMLATVNQVLDVDTATLAAAEFEYTVENVAFDVETLLTADASPQLQQAAVSRAPVVTVMGHVDHGKTSLLDAIRHTNVTAREAGGITQHIGAYDVEVNGKRITFLDTPGHEAFTAMRARGARVTDIVVLVVAADDGVMPQTIEAINHARAAGVPFIVALTKIDKPEANVERVKKEVASYGVVPEDWGGDAIFVPVSAKTGEGIPSLLEMILLQADVLELKASLAPLAKGTVVEAKLDKGRGPVATVLVQQGVLKAGDPCVCGVQYGKVRALFNSRGQRVTEAFPATPVEVLGLGGVPAAGDTFVVARDEIQARQVAEHRQGKQRTATLTTTRKFSLADLAQSAVEQKELRVVIKADVQGSVEALSEALQRLSTDEVKLSVLHASVGGISESDVLLAVASDGLIIGFQVRPEAKAAKLAEREGVEVRLYTVIYEVLADVRAALEGLLTPVQKEKLLGRIEVRQVFTIPRVGVVAGGLSSKRGKLPVGRRSVSSATIRSCIKAVWPVCGASRRTCGKWWRGMSAAWAWRIFRTSKPAMWWRLSKSNRSPADSSPGSHTQNCDFLPRAIIYSCDLRLREEYEHFPPSSRRVPREFLKSIPRGTVLMFLSATQLRVGMIIQHRDAPHRIMELTHVTPGNWRGFVRTKLRNLRTDLQTEHRFRSEEQVERIVLDQQEVEYLYQAGNDYYFMNVETYEQVVLSRETLREAVFYLTPNLRLRVDFYEGQPVALSLPKTVDLQVKDTPPGMKTASATSEMKPATLETGLEIRVPSFVSAGEMVWVDTETGEYLSRVK